jgi:hypothetical protein
MKHGAFRLLLVALATIGCLLTAEPRGVAAERAHDFLTALRRQGYYDEALDYLAQLRADPARAGELADALDYETGMVLAESAHAAQTPLERDKRFSEAKATLSKFLADHPEHKLAAATRIQLVGLLAEQAKAKVDAAAAVGQTVAQQNGLYAAAIAIFHEADALLVAAEQRGEEGLKRIGFVDPKDSRKVEERDQLRRDLLQTRLSRAWLTYEAAHATRAASPERIAALTEAGRKYGQLYEKYGGVLAGLYARLGQGRCEKELGHPAKAYAIFEELMAWPDEPEAFRAMKGKAAIEALQTALLPGAGKQKEALALVDAWEKAAAENNFHLPAEDETAIHYYTAELALAYARILKPEDAVQAAQRAAQLQTARQCFTLAAKAAGEYQQRARIKLLDPLLAASSATAKPTTFAMAEDRVKALVDQMTIAENDDKAAKTPAEHAEAQRRIATSRDEALKTCRIALKLPGGTPARIDALRYYQAYLHYKGGNYYEAATAGDYLARHAAQSNVAAEGAKIALAAYAALFRQAGDDRHWERQRLIATAQLLTERWGDEAAADEARMLLLQAALNDGKTAEARQWLGQIRADSARRGEAELSVGQALWAAYVRAARLPAGQQPPRTELDAMARDAQQMIAGGVERMRAAVNAGAEITYPLAAGALALAQMAISTNQASQAQQWLDDPKIGAKTLVDADAPVTRVAHFAVETYKTALRAYVALQQWEKAEQSMAALEKLIERSGDAEANKRLTQIYISLGRDLQDQLQRLRQQSDTERLGQVSQAFERFLTQIARRQDGVNFRSLHWVAETFLGMAAGFEAGGVRPTTEAAKYYRLAADSYRTILTRVEADPHFAPQPEAVTAVRIRLARCLRRLDKEAEALGLLVTVLKEHPTMVDAQSEAAYTYQAWGEEKSGYFALAIDGSQKYREIWGWAHLARRLMNDAKHREAFYEARYNLALCRFRLAQTAADSEERQRLAKLAEGEIRIVRALHADMGGKTWYDKNDELLRKIQTFRGEAVTGLAEPASGGAAAVAPAAVTPVKKE